MASVRIESAAFGDKRYDRLAVLLGLADADHARGRMTWLWRQCTIENRHELDDLDVQVVLGSKGVDALINSRLGERTPSGSIRIKGTDGKVEWLESLKGGAEAGGKARAASAERGPDGRMLPAQLDQLDVVKTANASSGVQRNPAPPAGSDPGPSSALVLTHVFLILDLAGDSLERTITTEQLNKAFERTWAWSISPRWYPSYSKLEPFSPAEIRAACLSLKRSCEKNGSKPNPGLMLRMLEEERRPPPVKSEAREVREREMAASPKPKRRGTYKPPDEAERFQSDGASAAKDIIAKLASEKGIDSS